MRPTDSEMASLAHGHISYSDLMFYQFRNSFRTARENVELVEGILKRKKGKMSKMFKAEDQALSFIESPGVYNCDFVEEMVSARRFCKRGLIYGEKRRCATQFLR